MTPEHLVILLTLGALKVSDQSSAAMVVQELLNKAALKVDTDHGRTVPEWIGKTPDTAVPPRVKLRVLARFSNRCQCCEIPITGRDWICDHTVALVNGGENRERNLRPICKRCDSDEKTPADVAIKSKTRAMAAAHFLKKKPKGRPMAGTKASGLRKRFDGTVERRR